MTLDTQFNPPEIPNQSAATMGNLRATNGSAGAGPRSGGAGVELAQRLFQAPERWGWEYVEPPAPVPYPHMAQYPQWVEPTPPDLRGLEHNLATAKRKQPKRVAWGGVLALIGLIGIAGSVAFGLIMIVIGAALGGFAIYNVSDAEAAIKRSREAAWARRNEVHANFLDIQRSWDERIAQHDAAERHRYDSAPLLFPLAPTGFANRVDVFGGIPTGWAALLATMGSSVLSSGSTMLVLDLSGQTVCGPLSDLRRSIGAPVQSASVPAALEASWLLGDLNARQLSDVLAEAMGGMRSKSDSIDLGSMDAEIIHTVARRLDQPLTFDRLAAGIRVLRSTYDPDEDDTVLAPTELARLTDRVDLIDKSERFRDELRFVEAQLTILGESERKVSVAKGDAQTLWPGSGLGVVLSEEKNRSRKRFVDQVLFQAVSYHLTSNRVGSADPVLVVVGADDLGRSALEAMARNAFAARVRLVYLFEHLREDAADLIGGGDSVTVLMRLGNNREAATAAEHVGRGFTFQLSQLSRQVGTNSSVTESHSTTITEGQSVTVGNSGATSRNWGASSGGSSSDSWSRSVTDNWSQSSQQGRSFSEGRSNVDGAVLQRSYEFTVEPTQIQELEPTTFLLIDNGRNGRQVRMADCFPGTVFVPRTSTIAR